MHRQTSQFRGFDRWHRTEPAGRAAYFVRGKFDITSGSRFCDEFKRLTKNQKEASMIQEKKRVLIVDDEASFTRLLKLNFHHTGRYIAETVNDSTQAVRVAKRFSPDVILLDVMMPGMDGGEVASRIHALPRLSHTPIVFLTAAIKRDE